MFELVTNVTLIFLTFFSQTHFSSGTRRFCSARHNVPGSTVSGSSLCEKLRNIYTQDALFHLHILKVEEYQGHWGNPATIMDRLDHVKNALMFIKKTLKCFLTHISQDFLEPPAPALLQLGHSDDYAKKSYGGCVVVRLKDWSSQVEQVLQEAKSPGLKTPC